MRTTTAQRSARRPATAAALALVLLAPGCRDEQAPRPPTPAAAFALVKRRVRAPRLLYDLLDERSRWSLISIHRDQQRAHALVKRHYPADRRERELGRTAMAAEAADPRAFFVALCRRERLLEPLRQLGESERSERHGARATVHSGGRRLEFCHEKGRWSFCGWRERFERAKLRSARDLAVVRRSVARIDKGGAAR